MPATHLYVCTEFCRCVKNYLLRYLFVLYLLTLNNTFVLDALFSLQKTLDMCECYRTIMHIKKCQIKNK